MSRFQITDGIANLFNNLTADQVLKGLTDYRCFYYWNEKPNAYFENGILTFNPDSANATYGCIIADDVQRLTFLGGNPDPDGYIILQSEFGPAFSVSVGDPVSYLNMANSIQENIRNFQYCSSVTAVLNIGPPVSIDVTFTDQVGKRNTAILKLIANRLQKTLDGHFPIEPYTEANNWNGVGDTRVRVDSLVNIDVNSYDVPGTLWVFNPNTGLYESYDYSAIDSALREFTLTTPLSFSLIPYDDCYVPSKNKDGVRVRIDKLVVGSPINTEAGVILSSELPPTGVSFGLNPLNLGTIFALEGFPVWCKREVTSGASGIESFYIELDGDEVSPS